MSRLLILALQTAGHEVEIISGLRTYSSIADLKKLNALKVAAAVEFKRIAGFWSKTRCPDVIIVYHPYYKAPDLLGSTLAQAFGLSYITIEASYAAKRRKDVWRDWQAIVEANVASAAINICMTRRDRNGLREILGDDAKLEMLAPFIALPDLASRERRQRSTVRLVTVAMMRFGDKLASYEFLADALSGITTLDWQIDIIGDGPARNNVMTAFGKLPGERVRWHGKLDEIAVSEVLSHADIYIWPGFGEAYGLAYLEAQAHGLPVIALDVAGVSNVVENGRSGYLINDRGMRAESLLAYQRAVAELIGDIKQRMRLGQSAIEFVRSERTIDGAAQTLDRTLKHVTDTIELCCDDQGETRPLPTEYGNIF